MFHRFKIYQDTLAAGGLTALDLRGHLAVERVGRMEMEGGKGGDDGRKRRKRREGDGEEKRREEGNGEEKKRVDFASPPSRQELLQVPTYVTRRQDWTGKAI